MRRSHLAFLASGFLLGLMVAGGIQLTLEHLHQPERLAQFTIAPAAFIQPATIDAKPRRFEIAPRLPFKGIPWQLDQGNPYQPGDPPPPAALLEQEADQWNSVSTLFR